MGFAIKGEDAAYAAIALHHKLTNKANLKKAVTELERRRSRGSNQSLGELLRELNLISVAGHTAVLRASAYKRERRSDKILGRILVEAEYTEKSNVTQALRDQKAHYGRTGQIVRIESTLQENGWITPYQLFAAKKILKLKLG